jgi:RNA polymerase sigma factor (sigma-70 family)
MLKLNFYPEREILQRIKANDRNILGEIFIKYEKLIFSYIKNHGGSNSDAEDILQEAIIVLWQKVNSGNFELSAKLSTFLLAVAKNKWMAEMRKRKKYSGQEIPENKPVNNPSSLEVLLSDEKKDQIQKALNKIHPLCRKLLLLFYFEEKSMIEIAKTLNLANTDVAKSKKYQCKKSLEEVLIQQNFFIEG